MIPEAKLTDGENGLVPEGEGWYVVNARESRWYESEAFDRFCHFQGDVSFSQLGVNLAVLQPGRPGCMYHGEANQEGFLVLSGECLLLVEGQERRLKAWDFFYCAPWTEHVLVGADSGPCLVLAVGARRTRELRYPTNELAQHHGASVLEETDSPAEAYARFAKPAERPYQDGDLPDW